MTEFTTPMMQQYAAIKNEYKDCLLFFRLGDFYELFMEDAHIGAQVLGITLTGRPRGKDGKIPMAGVPFHAVDTYLSKLVKAGYKVAICEQITEPSKKGIVEREVVRIVTPGTILDEQSLSKKEHNYICAINKNIAKIAIAYCDITTGDFWTQEFDASNIIQTIPDELSKTMPAECILPVHLYEDPDFLKIVSFQKGLSIFPSFSWNDYEKSAENALKEHFKVSTLAGFNIEGNKLLIKTSGSLLLYLKEIQKSTLSHIRKIVVKEPNSYVHLDKATIVNLELFSTIRDREISGSLLQTIDNTKTAMGGRLLKSWLLTPLVSKEKIEKRHAAVWELVTNNKIHLRVQQGLRDMNDLERILGRVSIRIGNARDLVSLATNLRLVFDIKHTLASSKSKLLTREQKNISTKLWQLIECIDSNIVKDPPIHLKEGGIIKDGVNKKLDELRDLIKNGKKWISDLESSERKRTQINSLKLRFNKVFGFYIEVSKANVHLVPDNYIRKQTLVNGERYITEELKLKEELILKCDEEIKKLEYQIYSEILDKTLQYTEEVQKAAHAISIIDCISSFAQSAKDYRYKKPTIVYSNELRIKDGLHPVVSQLVGRSNFVPNSINFGPSHAALYLITGPNMAGKSVYIRQTAIITLMALIGSFVPAKSAQIPIIDAIFVRSGASDVITSGLSTFMVEMVETAYILNNATEKSLIIMDEIGRGTSTYDGVSIAWATAEYLIKHFKKTPKTLFATHYFELTKLEEKFAGKIKNLHMEVIDDKGELIFVHSIKPGPASKSFGVAVASLAGMPQALIKSATKMLNNFESKSNPNSAAIKVLQEVDINNLTPLEAIQVLAEAKKKALP